MPLEVGDIGNVRVSHTAQTAENGAIVRMMTVSYTVRGQGPFSISVPAADFNKEAAERLMRLRASEIVAVLEIS